MSIIRDAQLRRFAEARAHVARAGHTYDQARADLQSAVLEMETAAAALAARVQIAREPSRPAALFPDRAA